MKKSIQRAFGAVKNDSIPNFEFTLLLKTENLQIIQLEKTISIKDKCNRFSSGLLWHSSLNFFKNIEAISSTSHRLKDLDNSNINTLLKKVFAL